MPLCTLHLLALHPSTPLSTFLSTLSSTPLTPLVLSQVIRWIILPTHLSTGPLLAHNIKWDILLILPGTATLPTSIQSLVAHEWRITAGVPSRLVKDFAQKNKALLNPESTSEIPLDHSKEGKRKQSSQSLELSVELDAWIDGFVAKGGRAATGAVSMFNLLAFEPGMKSEYLKYGAAFAERVGKRHGGDAKIVGNVVAGEQSKQSESGGSEYSDNAGWDEIALAHYPSISHFRAMLLDDEYQAVNHKHRVGSLRDTAILMTSEIAIEEMSGKAAQAKL